MIEKYLSTGFCSSAVMLFLVQFTKIWTLARCWALVGWCTSQPTGYPLSIGWKKGRWKKTSTPPKFNMEPENDGFQEELPFLGTSFRFHVKFQGCRLFHKIISHKSHIITKQYQTIRWRSEVTIKHVTGWVCCRSCLHWYILLWSTKYWTRTGMSQCSTVTKKY